MVTALGGVPPVLEVSDAVHARSLGSDPFASLAWIRSRHTASVGLDINSSPNPGKSAAACFVIEHRQLGGKVVARIGNVTVNDRNHVFYRTHEEFATLAAAILAIPVL